jgi:hypothetical protein
MWAGDVWRVQVHRILDDRRDEEELAAIGKWRDIEVL